jgi:hypothetical protein
MLSVFKLTLSASFPVFPLPFFGFCAGTLVPRSPRRMSSASAVAEAAVESLTTGERHACAQVTGHVWRTGKAHSSTKTATNKQRGDSAGFDSPAHLL